MLPQQMMCANQRVAIIRNLFAQCILNQSICCRIILQLLGKTDATKHPESVRLEGHDRVGMSEQQYLLRTGITDAGEFLQCLLRLRQRFLED